MSTWTMLQGWLKRWGRGVYVCPPDFDRIECAAGQQWRAPLLLAHPDFQTLRHPCSIHTDSIEYKVFRNTDLGVTYSTED